MGVVVEAVEAVTTAIKMVISPANAQNNAKNGIKYPEAPRSLFLNLKSKEVLMIIRGLSDFNNKKNLATNHSSHPLSKVYTMAYPLLLTKCILYHETKFLCHILLTLFVTKWILYDIYSVLFCSHFLPPLYQIYMW